MMENNYSDIPVVRVVDGNLEAALLAFKQKMKRSGVLIEHRRHASFQTARERRNEKEKESIKRRVKAGKGKRT